MRTFTLALGALAALASCSDDDATPAIDAAVTGDGNTVVDAAIDASPILPDAPTAVRVIACPPGNNIPTVETVGSAYSPMATTVDVDGIVKFIMPATHNVVPDPTLATDDGLRVPFSMTRCLQFTTAGTFNFKCGPHNFKGSVTVN